MLAPEQIADIANYLVVEYLDQGVEFMTVVEYMIENLDSDETTDDELKAIHDRTYAILNELAGNL